MEYPSIKNGFDFSSFCCEKKKKNYNLTRIFLSDSSNRVLPIPVADDNSDHFSSSITGVTSWKYHITSPYWKVARRDVIEFLSCS